MFAVIQCVVVDEFIKGGHSAALYGAAGWQLVLHGGDQSDISEHCLPGLSCHIQTQTPSVGGNLGNNLIVVLGLALKVVAAVLDRKIGEQVSLDCGGESDHVRMSGHSPWQRQVSLDYIKGRSHGTNLNTALTQS